jgi:hypothetical protein
MGKERIVRLQLDEEAKRVLDRLCDRRGMTQVATISRLVTWLGKQDEVVQAHVLGHLSPDLLEQLHAHPIAVKLSKRSKA